MATTPLTTRAEPAVQPHIRGLWWKLGTGLWMSLGILAAFLAVGPVLNAEGKPTFTMGGYGAKILFFHVPCAWLASLTYVISAWYAARFLRAQRAGGGRADAEDAEDDLKCAAAMELGLLFAILATVTGSIFSHNEWGLYWSWDPRQTSILVILLIFSAYLALRAAVTEPQTRARLSSVYALVAIVPSLFLIWVLPRIVETLHGEPNKTLVGGQISGNYRLVMYGLILPAFIGLFIWLFQLRLRVMKIEQRET